MGLDTEVWKEVDGYGYEVSNLGNVRRKTDKRILTPILRSDSYCVVGLWQSGRRKTAYVHRLVGVSFVEGWFEGATIDHIDGNRMNNAASNLRWVTQKKNIYESFQRGRQRRQARAVMQLDGQQEVALYESVADAFRATGIRHISEAASGKRKTAGGYRWLYQEGMWSK